MKKCGMLALFLAFVTASSGTAWPAGGSGPQGQAFAVGGVSIRVPPPSTEFVEVGAKNRALMESLMKSTSRMLIGFVVPGDRRNAGKNDTVKLERYGVVYLLRQMEYRNCSPGDFRNVVRSVQKAVGDPDSTIKETEQLFERRLKALQLKNTQVSIHHPIQLGRLFYKPGAYGTGMVMTYTMAGVQTKMAMEMTVLRTKNRLLCLSLYSVYKDEDTIRWLRRVGEGWADRILAANR